MMVVSPLVKMQLIGQQLKSNNRFSELVSKLFPFTPFPLELPLIRYLSSVKSKGVSEPSIHSLVLLEFQFIEYN